MCLLWISILQSPAMRSWRQLLLFSVHCVGAGWDCTLQAPAAYCNIVCIPQLVYLGRVQLTVRVHVKACSCVCTTRLGVQRMRVLGVSVA